jgi:hypothetical protein
VLFVVEYDLLDEQHLILHFDLIFQEQIVVPLNFQLKVRRDKVEHIYITKYQMVHQYFLKEFHQLQFVQEQEVLDLYNQFVVFLTLNFDNNNPDDRMLV